jgi:hypothetical protein
MEAQEVVGGVVEYMPRLTGPRTARYHQEADGGVYLVCMARAGSGPSKRSASWAILR